MPAQVDCPYCGEPFQAVVDTSAGDQSYMEDCPVCCRPIEFQLNVAISGEDYTLTLARDDD